MEWRNDDGDTGFTVHVEPEPRGPLKLHEHVLFALLMVAILGICTLLVLMSGGAA